MMDPHYTEEKFNQLYDFCEAHGLRFNLVPRKEYVIGSADAKVDGDYFVVSDIDEAKRIALHLVVDV